MKDISNSRQPSFLLMKIDENGDKHWRLNFNVVEKQDEDAITHYECDFVPENGGLISDVPTADLFHDELIKFGLTEEEISKI